jgi:heat shock protein HslJ
VQLGDGPHVSAYDNQPEPHLVLETGSGRFHGAGGCNRLRGNYSLDGRWLRFSAVGGTRMACVQGMRREQLLMATLAQVSSYAVQGQKLVLSDAEGRVLLRFEAVSALSLSVSVAGWRTGVTEALPSERIGMPMSCGISPDSCSAR